MVVRVGVWFWNKAYCRPGDGRDHPAHPWQAAGSPPSPTNWRRVGDRQRLVFKPLSNSRAAANRCKRASSGFDCGQFARRHAGSDRRQSVLHRLTIAEGWTVATSFRCWLTTLARRLVSYASGPRSLSLPLEPISSCGARCGARRWPHGMESRHGRGPGRVAGRDKIQRFLLEIARRVSGESRPRLAREARPGRRGRARLRLAGNLGTRIGRACPCSRTRTIIATL